MPFPYKISTEQTNKSNF